ncbi:MAG: hypothetical protein WBZ48_02835, partial [Bacteroidota bacterium]
MTPNSDDFGKKAAEKFAEYLTNHNRESMLISQQINSLRARQAEMDRKLDGFIHLMAGLTGLPKERMQKTLLDVHFSLIGKSIGDAMELILLSEGAQKQKYLIEKMRADGVKISTKAPYAVIKNAILRDKRK